MKKKLFQEFKTNGVPYEDMKKMKFFYCLKINIMMQTGNML